MELGTGFVEPSYEQTSRDSPSKKPVEMGCLQAVSGTSPEDDPSESACGSLLALTALVCRDSGTLKECRVCLGAESVGSCFCTCKLSRSDSALLAALRCLMHEVEARL